MKTNRNRVLSAMVLAAAGTLVLAANFSFSDEGPGDEWKVPGFAARKQNPVPADANSIAAGKKIYLANCMACHGTAGKGDGPAAVACNPKPKDLSDPKISAQSDGELFYKLTKGKPPMPSFEKTLSDIDRWNAINYVRVLAPPPSTQPSGTN
jgi:mono/diheme cytochrome c family protein